MKNRSAIGKNVKKKSCSLITDLIILMQSTVTSGRQVTRRQIQMNSMELKVVKYVN